MEELLTAPLQAKIALVTLFLALAISLVTDLRRRLILNAVTMPALAIVALCFFWLGGLPLLADSALGLLVCAGPLALATMVNSKLWGWGDIKLIAVSGAVAGAAAGWGFAFTVLVYVSIVGGAQVVLWMLAAKLRGQDLPKYVPYGVSIAVGTAAAFFWAGALF